jgi:hypothetical protein
MWLLVSVVGALLACALCPLGLGPLTVATAARLGLSWRRGGWRSASVHVLVPDGDGSASKCVFFGFVLWCCSDMSLYGQGPSAACFLPVLTAMFW